MWYTVRIYKLGIINIPNNTIGLPYNMLMQQVAKKKQGESRKGVFYTESVIVIFVRLASKVTPY